MGAVMNRVAALQASRLSRLAARLSLMAYGPNAQESRDPKLYRVLVHSLFSSPTSIILSNVVGAAISLFCWKSSGNPIFLPIFWLTAVIVALRIVTVWRYHAAIRRREQTDEEIRAWDREFFIGATAFSAVLGMMCFIALAWTDDIPSHIITIVAAIAFSAGYVARNAGRPIFVIVQLLAFCAPMAIGLSEAEQPFYSAISGFIAFFIITNIAIAFSLNRNLLELAAARKRSETLATSLRSKNLTLDSALNSMMHGLVMFNARLELELANLRFAEMYRLGAEDLTPGTLLTRMLDRLIAAQVLAPAAARDLGEVCRRALRSGQTNEIEIMTERGQIFVVHAEVTGDGGILMVTEDATERKAAAAQIERLAHSDNLTGLPNRFRFNQVLRKVCAEATGGRDKSFAVLYIDLDNFKSINDSLGHECGDQLLVQVAERLQTVLSQGELVARFGGDEFLLLSRPKRPEDAVATAERILEAMRTPFDLAGRTLYVTTSVGIALIPEHGDDPSDVLRAADMALYAAKAAGRNTVVMFEPQLAENLNTRRELEQDLREACRTGKLFLHYQPIVNLRSRRVVSYEALMRWEHPTRGFVPPSDFIPIAEQTGLIVEMGEWAIRRACMDARNWPADVSVAVNVSAFQFKSTAGLISAVKDALLISRLPANRLELEVTESLLIEDQEASLEAIQALHRIGVRFSLDDFGIGYSSLAYLARYPFSKVKIDRTFAQHVTSDGPSRSIIEVVCQLADRLGMQVVVEGIESEQQRREVEALGAEQAQGYLFGKPQPVAQLVPRQDAA
ncbi:putative bifunctional diguanylate cyclase/phosphodiesterase [Enterovirga aerilata]|uniref:EAL domain-containing protein n=1 Tax=Enterovirga aerilata TaxID=2730920 RepID=A0A849IME2_9HYPH|nr:EAL domain-containing protein [Enterovirga sp. DB1703]NNM75113.1 EAL domain-containing protein [Enterovirga sp. DB1703]